jgi:tetratricopeptide (TPR) repeat protein
MTPPLSSIDPVEIDLNAEEAAPITQVSVEQPSAPLALQKTPVLELPVKPEAEEREGDEEDDPLASFIDVDEVSAELLNVEAWEEAVPSSMTRSAEPGPLMGELLEAEPLTGQPEQAQREAPLSSQHHTHQDDQALNSHEPDDSVSQLDLADVWQSDEGWELKTEISAFPQTQADARESLTRPQIEEPKDPPEGAQLASMKLNYAHLEGDERWEVALEIAQFARDEELNLEEAQRFYWEALRAPDSQRELTSVAAEELAELLTVSQDHRGMLSLYEEMLKRSLKPAAELHRLKALTLNTLGHKEEALAALEQSVAAGGDGSVELRVSILTELGHLEEAVSQLDAAAESYEGNQRPQAMRARAIYLAQAAGLLKESYPQEALIRLKEAYHSDGTKERLEHWHRLALSVGDPYDQVEATEAYVERLAQEPDSLSLRERLLSKLAQELEEPSPMHSLALYREALELNPESFEVADKLCELSIKMEALEPLSLGLKRLLPLCLEGEFKGRLFVRLAYTLGALGDVEGAEEQLRYALVELMTEGGALEEPRELSEVILWGRAMCTEAVAEPLNQLISSSPISAHLNL